MDTGSRRNSSRDGLIGGVIHISCGMLLLWRVFITIIWLWHSSLRLGIVLGVWLFMEAMTILLRTGSVFFLLKVDLHIFQIRPFINTNSNDKAGERFVVFDVFNLLFDSECKFVRV